MNRKLDNVTLVSVACTRVPETVNAMRNCLAGMDFREAILITDQPMFLDKFGIRVVNIERLDYKAYNHFILYRLKDHVSADYTLVVQNDGYIVRPEKWDEEFFKYDYIGAPWPENMHFTPEGMMVRVGNGGFSFRSRKLLEAPSRLSLPFTDHGTGHFHEDGNICVYHRKKLEEYGIRFPSAGIAARFSGETVCVETVRDPFGFHRNKKFLPVGVAARNFVRNKLAIHV